MVMPKENVLCAIRVAGKDIVLTSDRLIIQSLPFSVSLLHFILRGIFLFLPSEDAIFGSHRYVAWEGDTMVSGVTLGPPKDQKKVIAPSRIIHNIPYDNIVKLTIERLGSSFRGAICTEESSLPFGLDEVRFPIFWHFISVKLADIIDFPGKEEMSKLKYVWMSDFCNYLHTLGFQVEVIENPLKGTTIRLGESSFDRIIRGTGDSLTFDITKIKGKLQRLELKTEQKGQATRLTWDSKNKQLAESLNSDPSLMNWLLNLKTDEKYKEWDIQLSNVSEEGEHFIRITNSKLNYLPPKEFFQAMDKIAYYVKRTINP